MIKPSSIVSNSLGKTILTAVEISTKLKLIFKFVLAGEDIGEQMSRSILDLQKSELSSITHIQGTGGIRQRLLDMGLMPKQTIQLTRIAPGGAPLWIQIGSNHLALRREEAALVLLSDSESIPNNP